MGDRTHCILTILGQLPIDLGVTLRNSMGKPNLMNERQREYEEVNYGELDQDLREKLAAEKIDFTWQWGAGGGYGAGILVCHDGKLEEFATNWDGDIVMTLREIADLEHYRQWDKISNDILGGREVV